jgi:arsenate reductase-like glutaredoxin family protein
MNLGAVKRLKGLLNVDLLALAEGDPPLLTRLAMDVILLCDVIFALVKPQADELGVTDEQFAAALGGDAILSAQKAFYEEMADFFLKLGRDDLAKALTAQQALIGAAVAETNRRLSLIDPEAEVKAIFATRPANEFGGRSTSSPESVE